VSEPSLRKEALLASLTTRSLGRKLFLFEELDSTNACARTLADSGIEEGTVVIAEYQTSGRGRQGRIWMSERGKNLLLSIVFRPPPEAPMWQLPFLLSEGAARGVEHVIGTRVHTKWPNDLVLNGRKCAGILVEQSASEGAATAIAGIGINVNQSAFPEELAITATSLKIASGRSVDRLQLFQTVLASIESLYEAMIRGSGEILMKEWKQRCVTFGRKITIEHGNERLEGVALGLNEEGGLIVDLPGGPRTVYAGDVTITETR